MHFCYRACIINATPEFSLGRYFAHARIDQSQDLSECAAFGSYDSGDLGDFASEADAIAVAHAWAIEWIDARLDPHSRHPEGD